MLDSTKARVNSGIVWCPKFHARNSQSSVLISLFRNVHVARRFVTRFSPRFRICNGFCGPVHFSRLLSELRRSVCDV